MQTDNENIIAKLWRSFKNAVDSILHPATCILCARDHDFTLAWICETCMQKLYASFHLSKSELRLENDAFSFPVYSGWYYTESIQSVIHALKYDKHNSIGPFLGRLLVQNAEGLLKKHQNSLLVPVPLHARRLKERGFNQSECIAQGIVALNNSVVIGPYLKRIVYTKNQAQLSHDERQQNVRGAFAVCRRSVGKLKNSHIILIDDVFTTGATMRECAKALYKCGAAKLIGLTFATARKNMYLNILNC